MKAPHFYPALALLLAALVFALTPRESQGQAQDPAGTMAALVQEIRKQQQSIAENQTEIERRMTALQEELRTARIFVSRSGGTRPQ